MNKKIKKPNLPKKGNNDDTTLWIIVGGLTLVLGGVGYWYYKKRKAKQDAFPMGITDTTSAKPIVRSGGSGTVSTSGSTSRPSRFRCTSSSYPLQYGTCHKDVKVLQSYLVKMYKEDIGASGRNKDGVDGMFGNKTSRAAKKHLGKVSFSSEDIAGMKRAIKMIKR